MSIANSTNKCNGIISNQQFRYILWYYHLYVYR
jgi:hypothetical protein